MLPEALACDRASLDPGVRRPSISVFADVTPAFAIERTYCARTWTTATAARTYDDVRASLESDPSLKALLAFSESLKEARVARGAQPIRDGYEVRVRVTDGLVRVGRIDRGCPARNLVAELMIFANGVIARTLIEAEVGCVFRTQPLASSTTGEAAPVGLPPVTLSTTPAPHATLGVDAYTQATSPLRRYTDLLVQRQLGALLDGTPPPCSAEELRALVEQTDYAVSTTRTIERWANRYWILVHLQGRTGQTLDAVVVERRTDCCIVELTEYLVRSRLYPSRDKVYEPGALVGVELCEVHPRRAVVRVREAITQ